MKTGLLLLPAAILWATTPLFSAEPGKEASKAPGILQLLSSGDQKTAEARLQGILADHPDDLPCAFLAAVCDRSEAMTGSAAARFLEILHSQPNTTEGRAAACVLGIDLSNDETTALYYFNALLVLAKQNPDSVPLHWLAAQMAASVSFKYQLTQSSEMGRRILMCGIREFETLQGLMSPGPGPVRAQRRLADLLYSVSAYESALKYREMALKVSRDEGCLAEAASTYLALDRPLEARALIQEAISKAPGEEHYYLTLGYTYYNLGLTKDAIKEWTRGLQINPECLDQLGQLALAHRDLGDYVSARKYTQQKLALVPDDPQMRILDARMAANLGDPGSAELLKKAGTLNFEGKPVPYDAEDFDPKDDPWFLAAHAGDFKKIRQMIDSVDINAGNPKSYHQTALMNAASLGWEQMAADLIKAGAKLDLVDDNGDTALHYSAQFAQPRVMRLLLDAGADPNLQDRWKQTPLTMATFEYRRDCFYMLVENKKVDVNIATPQRGTALHYSVGRGRIARMNAILARGAKVDTPATDAGNTALMTACKDWPHPSLITPLLAAGADVNARDNDGRTALHYAVNPLLSIPLVDILLEKGGNPAQADKEGITPIAQARLLGFEDIAKKMEKKAGKTEPFQFPKFESPDPSLTAEEKNAVYYVFPILLAQGHPLGRASGVRIGEKRAARRELRWMFEIHDAETLKTEIQELEAFTARYRDAAGILPPDVTLDELGGRLTSAAKQIHRSCSQDAVDETAWIKAHIIYLADLGVAAEYLDAAEGAKLIHDASAVLKSKFASWPEFNRSFLLGAQFHNAWEADRYEQVCNRILDARLAWP